jgi:hypothetical protein
MHDHLMCLACRVCTHSRVQCVRICKCNTSYWTHRNDCISVSLRARVCVCLSVCLSVCVVLHVYALTIVTPARAQNSQPGDAMLNGYGGDFRCVCMYACMYVDANIHTFTCMDISTQINAYACACIQTYTCVCMYTYMYIHALNSTKIL